MSHFRLALALACCVAIAPFALDAYLPAFPDIALALGVSVHEVSVSVSVYMIALAIGQLVGGPLADRWGRQGVMMTGLVLFVISSLAISQSTDLSWLLSWRFVQAFGGGWVTVCVPALVRDRVRGIEAARLFSLIGLITVAAPAVAPSIGSLLLAWGGWEAVFYFIAAYGVLAALAAKKVVFARQHRVEKPLEPPSEGSIARRYWTVLTTPSSLRYVFLQASVFSVMMLFVTHASFIYQQYFGVSTTAFSALFGANVLLMWNVMLLNRWLLGRISPARLLRAGVTVQAAAVGAMLLVAIMVPKLALFAPALMLTVGAVGATSPNCQACYMEHFGRNGGTAAALMGAAQFGIAGLISTASTLLPETLVTIVTVQSACALVALGLAWWPTFQRRLKTTSRMGAP